MKKSADASLLRSVYICKIKKKINLIGYNE